MAISEVFRNLHLVLKQNLPHVNRSVNNSSNLKSSSMGQQSRNGTKSVIENLTVQKEIEEPEETSWTEDQVDEWFDKMNIDNKIVENLTPCNGKGNCLAELNVFIKLENVVVNFSIFVFNSDVPVV